MWDLWSNVSPILRDEETYGQTSLFGVLWMKYTGTCSKYVFFFMRWISLPTPQLSGYGARAANALKTDDKSIFKVNSESISIGILPLLWSFWVVTWLVCLILMHYTNQQGEVDFWFEVINKPALQRVNQSRDKLCPPSLLLRSHSLQSPELSLIICFFLPRQPYEPASSSHGWGDDHHRRWCGHRRSRRRAPTSLPPALGLGTLAHCGQGVLKRQQEHDGVVVAVEHDGAPVGGEAGDVAHHVLLAPAVRALARVALGLYLPHHLQGIALSFTVLVRSKLHCIVVYKNLQAGGFTQSAILSNAESAWPVFTWRNSKF